MCLIEGFASPRITFFIDSIHIHTIKSPERELFKYLRYFKKVVVWYVFGNFRSSRPFATAWLLTALGPMAIAVNATRIRRINSSVYTLKSSAYNGRS